MTTDKQYYRDYINEKKPYLNLSALCREVGLAKQSLTVFLKGYDGAVSMNNLQAIVDFLDTLFKN